MCYIVDIHKNGHVYNASCNQAIDDDGSAIQLYNGVKFNFVYRNDEINILDGTHIGTDSFNFKELDGDNCEGIVEYYHPGLLSQVRTRMENR